MALKDRIRRAIGGTSRTSDHDRTSSTSSSSHTSTKNTTHNGTHTGTTTPSDHPLTASTTTSSQHTNTNLHPTQTLTPTPTITLTKTSSSLLSKTLTWRSHTSSSDSTKSKEKQKLTRAQKATAKKVEAWKREDADEWSAPATSRRGNKDRRCVDTLRAFDFTQFAGDDREERKVSVGSAVSPGASRAGSVVGEDLVKVLSSGEKGSKRKSVGLRSEVGWDEGGGDGDGEKSAGTAVQDFSVKA